MTGQRKGDCTVGGGGPRTAGHFAVMFLQRNDDSLNNGSCMRIGFEFPSGKIIEINHFTVGRGFPEKL